MISRSSLMRMVRMMPMMPMMQRMMSARPEAIVLLLATVACGKRDDAQPAGSASGAVVHGGPVRVAFGDCAPVETSFESGPRPMKFDASAITASGYDPPTVDEASAGAPTDADPPIQQFIETDIEDFGFGEAGFGPGSGGSGWGRIGYGNGNMARGRPSTVPQLRLGQATVTGELDNAIIRRYVRRQQAKFLYCYEKQLLANPALAGVVDVSFTIAPTGNVAKASATGVDKTVASCVADVVKTTAFPKPKSGSVDVVYPLTFLIPSRDEPDPTAAMARWTPDSGSASNDSPQAIAQLPGRTPPDPDGPYVPGADNPMRGKGELFEACFRRQPRMHATLVVDMTFDANGAVTAASAHGPDDAAFKACLATAAKQLRRDPAAAGAARCSVAFGTMPVADAPAVEVTEQAIAIDGKPVFSVERLLAGNPFGAAGQPLLDAATALKHRGAGSIVRTSGPVVLRAIDTTPIRAIDSLLVALGVSEIEPVLAFREGTEWKLLRPIELPVVPIPVGTGGMWDSRSGRAVARHIPDTAPIELSIFVAPTSVWIGTNAGERTSTPIDWTAIEAKLAEWRKRPDFAERTRIIVDAHDDATYGQLVRAIRAATTAGFTDWSLRLHSFLSKHAKHVP